MAKESVVKKVGGFVANELLGVDDAKRAINKARKGDIKGAIKSAATGALEAGTTLTGAGIGAKLGAKVGLKAGKEIAESAAKRSAGYAEKRALEAHPTPKLGKQGGEIKSVKTSSDTSAYVYKQGHNPVTKPRVEVTEPKKVVYKSKENTFEQRVGVQKAQEKAREKAGMEARVSSYESSRATSKAPAAGKATGKVAGAVAGTAAVAATKKVETPKGTQKGHAVTSVNRKTGKPN
jgi:hypothetical protein